MNFTIYNAFTDELLKIKLARKKEAERIIPMSPGQESGMAQAMAKRPSSVTGVVGGRSNLLGNTAKKVMKAPSPAGEGGKVLSTIGKGLRKAFLKA